MYVALRSDGEQSLAIARQLIAYGADVNAKSYSGFGDERTRHDGYNHDVESGHEPPLHWAARKGNAPLVQLLLDNGADPDAKTTSVRTNERDGDGYYVYKAGGGETPRDWAFQSGDESTILVLNGDDALDYIASAARAGMTDRVRTLIDTGKDVNQSLSFDESAIHYAIQRRDAEFSRVLTDAGADPNVDFHNGYMVLDILHHTERNRRLPDGKRNVAIDWIRTSGGKTHEELEQERRNSKNANEEVEGTL